MEAQALDEPMVEVRYTENGRLITAINIVMGFHADHYTGCDPHRFTPAMRALGAAPENQDYGPLGPRGLFFRLAEDLGVGHRRPTARTTGSAVRPARFPSSQNIHFVTSPWATGIPRVVHAVALLPAPAWIGPSNVLSYAVWTPGPRTRGGGPPPRSDDDVLSQITVNTVGL